MPSPTQLRGFQAQQQAERFLLQHGLTLVERNYCCYWGEIDLIMQEQSYWVFVEVRWRWHPRHGHPLASITRSKQQRIIKTAQCYLVNHNLYDKVDCRFDAMGMDAQAEIMWIKNAFS